MAMTRSESLFARARVVMPGGVNSPVRAFRSVGGTPRFIDRAKGSRIWDVDGNEYVDLVMSWGPLILGHADDRVVRAAVQAVGRGSSFGAPTEVEVRLAELVTERFPSMDMVRMVNSGTEATMSAIRVARAYTGRTKVIKFDGCWHGHVDGLLVRTGSTGLQYGVPDSAGVPRTYAQETLVATYNDLGSVQALAEQHSDDLAAIIVEPVAGNMGVVPPAPGFLEGLRRVADGTGAVLIFDEVITGFRVAPGGAQGLYGIHPDMTTLGKIIGGGFPVGAYGGRRDIMQQVSPLGPMVQAGTLSGNPVAMSAGIAVLEALDEPGVYEALEARTAKLTAAFTEAADRARVTVTTNRVGSMFTVFHGPGPYENADQVGEADAGAYARFFHAMLENGVALPPSYCEAAFVSTAHTDEDLSIVAAAAERAFAAVRES